MGYRSGGGEAEMVVLPGTLRELWQVLGLCVEARRIIILQAANTGLTEGSTPKGPYARPVVIINTLRLDRIHLIREGRQVICHAGATLHGLEKALAPVGREPHSVIGSTCIGASVVGGVCNNSGGSLVQRGPSFTELALFARIDAGGTLQLVNHLGVHLGATPDEILGRLDRGEIAEADVDPEAGRASDSGYADRVRDVDAATPARFNADPGRLFEASGCAGKVAVFAVRLDTFPTLSDARVYYVGTNDTARLTLLRRRLPTELPISGEYMHRDAFEVARRYGKDTRLAILWLGTSRMPGFFALKARIGARLRKWAILPRNVTDRLLQLASRLIPGELPSRMIAYRDGWEHHLILKVSGRSAAMTERILHDSLPRDGWFACTLREGKLAMLHRFAAAGAAVRYQAIHAGKVADILARDIALRRNDPDRFERLPAEIEGQMVAKLYYGHFLCHVFHQDYVLRRGADPKAVKRALLKLLDHRQAEHPAEHNVGHLYRAKPELADFYRSLDPSGSFNPVIGRA